MGPTEYLAPWIDRSYHLISSCSSGSADWRLSRPADLLSGDCGCIEHPRTVVTLARRQQLPGDAGNLVGERHRRELRRLARQQRHEPGCRTAAALLRLLDDGGSSRYQHAAQHLISGAGDLADPGLAGGGMILRGQP